MSLGTRASPHCEQAFLGGQLAEFLDHGQVAVVASSRPGPIRALTPSEWGGRCRLLFAFETIGAVFGRGGFTLSTEELILKLAVLGSKLLDLDFESLGPLHGACVLSLPVSGLLSEFGVLTPQFVDFLVQAEQFATQLPHQIGDISRLEGRMELHKGAVHNTNACNAEPTSKEGPTGAKNGFGEGLQLSDRKSRQTDTRSEGE